jgi:hypothetical protein
MINFRGKDVREAGDLEQMELLSKQHPDDRKRVLPAVDRRRGDDAQPQPQRRTTLPESMEKINNLWSCSKARRMWAMLRTRTITDGIILGASLRWTRRWSGGRIAQLRKAIGETVDTDLVSVAPGDFPSCSARPCLKRWAERVAEKAALDYQFHTAKRSMNPKGFARALREVRTTGFIDGEERATCNRASRITCPAAVRRGVAENFDATPAAQAWPRSTRGRGDAV